jgi:two-component system, OmpR family, sensor kinase
MHARLGSFAAALRGISMASLHTRVLASVLALAAAGLLALAAVTYLEQRSFLQSRANQQAKAAVPALSDAMQSVLAPSDLSGEQNGAPLGPGGGGGPGGPGMGPSLPPGTYGQRRTYAGGVSASHFFTYGESRPPAPKLPRNVPIDALFTVGSVGSSGLHYRVYAMRDPGDQEVTIAAVPLSDLEQTLHRLLLVEGLVIAGVLLALGVGAFFVVRVGLRPLDRIEATAGQIAAGDLSRRVSPADQRTEVGRLGLTLNAMLDRLEQAFTQRKRSEERLRQFLADASHELRTPLASIRGYAELFRMGAAEQAGGADTAMRRIEDESARMGLLVEDMLTLAHLDEQPDLRKAAVDVAQLARDAAADACAIAPARTISVHAPESVILEGDPHQLRQVFSNLTRNALLHTPASAEIEISVTERRSAVTVCVRDHGPGLPPGSHEHLFERFWRSEGGRERGRAGAGLGLAIARGIVTAHGGTISAEDAPGGGAQFVVSLPRKSPQPSPNGSS